jgi:hypothetical protein
MITGRGPALIAAVLAWTAAGCVSPRNMGAGSDATTPPQDAGAEAMVPSPDAAPSASDGNESPGDGPLAPDVIGREASADRAIEAPPPAQDAPTPSPVEMATQELFRAVEPLRPLHVAVRGNAMVVVGEFTDAQMLGGSALAPYGMVDLFVAKYALDGTLLWAHSLGSAFNDTGYAVALDDAGNVFFTGTASGNTVDLGGLTVQTDSNRGFLAKYAGDTGKLLWGNADGGYDLRLTATGVIAVGGRLTAYDSGGTQQWSRDSFGYVLAVDDSGNVLTAVHEFVSGTTPGHIVVTKDTPAGAALWSTTLTSSSGNLQVNSLEVDAAGEVYLGGPHADDLRAGQKAFAGAAAYFVAKLSGAGGVPLWLVPVRSPYVSQGAVHLARVAGQDQLWLSGGSGPFSVSPGITLSGGFLVQLGTADGSFIEAAQLDRGVTDFVFTGARRAALTLTGAFGVFTLP